MPKVIFKPSLYLSLLLGACTALPLPGITSQNSLATGPPNPEPGACYGSETSPAIIETVTKQVLVQPASYDDKGVLISPAVYSTETLQKIVTERVITWFKTPCASDLNPEFTASVQRALKVRGFYFGTITGQEDFRTRRAIMRYQKKLGLNSGTLSLAGARALGLVAYEREG